MKNINGGAVFHVVCQVVTYPIRYEFLAEGSFSRIQSGENRRSVHSARGEEGRKKSSDQKKTHSLFDNRSDGLPSVSTQKP